MIQIEYATLSIRNQENAEQVAYDFETEGDSVELIESETGILGVLNRLGLEGWNLIAKDGQLFYFSRPATEPEPEPEAQSYYVLYNKVGRRFLLLDVISATLEEFRQHIERRQKAVERGEASVTQMGYYSEPFGTLDEVKNFVFESCTLPEDADQNLRKLRKFPIYTANQITKEESV